MNKYEGFVGKVLDGRYKILELVGVGGMACVMKAQDLVMNRIVAIKILNDEYNGNEEAEARFLDESKAVAMLSNKYIVSVYDVAIYPDIKYIVMEYLDGITLREYLDNKGALSWKEACIYISQILRALEHAHSKGIIHRDIKPQNVILMKNGDIKVTDFGIAKLPNAVSEQKDEKAVGTVYYISPEQACGKETDFYSDIYSVGIMFYEAVTGTLPFIADTPMDVAMMQVNDDPVHPRDIVLDIPVGVSQIILKAMEKSPSDRFQSAHTMVKAIEWVLRNPDVIFAMNSSTADETVVNGSVVSIDMIATAEIEPYDEEDLSDTIQKQGLGCAAVPPTKKDKTTKNTNNKNKKTKKKKTNKSMFPIIAGVSIAFFIVALLLGVFILRDVYTSFTSTDNDVEIEFPDLTNMLFTDELKNDLRNGVYGGKFIIDEVVYDNRHDLPNNQIISTEPEAGHLSKPGSDGKLHFTQITVNRSEKVFVPHLEGYAKTTVQTMLSALELKVEFVNTADAKNPYYQSGQAIDSYPVAGTEVKVGDTITVYIYAKPDSSKNTAKMPDLIGMTEDDAIKFAETYAKYKVEIIYTVVDDGDDTVISQSVSAGKVSPVGTTVEVEIGVAPDGLPDFVGLKPDDAAELIFDTLPDSEVTVNYLYYYATRDNKKYIEEALEEFEGNYDGFLGAIETLGCVATENYDGKSKIIFQSVEKDTTLTESFIEDFTDIEFIIIQYVSEIPDETSGDDTHDDGNTEEDA